MKIIFLFLLISLQSCTGEISKFATNDKKTKSESGYTGSQDATSEKNDQKTTQEAASANQKSPKEPTYSLLVPITPFSNMASGYQATNPGFRAILKDASGQMIASGPMTIDAAIKGTTDDASQGSAYGRLILNIDLAFIDPRYSDMKGDGSGSLSICMNQSPDAPFNQSNCKSLSGNIHPERPFQWIDKKVSFHIEDKKITISKFEGNTGEGGTSRQIALAVYHPAYGFLAPGKAFKDYQSPLVLDWNHDGRFDLTDVWDLKKIVEFDLTGMGKKFPTGWIGRTEAFLARDINHNGIIDSGRELFGEHYASLESKKQYENGFLALAQHDENHDGIIDAKDPIFSELLIWRDLNHNGISEPNELTRLDTTDVASIHLAYETVKSPLGAIRVLDNEIRVKSTFKTKSGESFSIVDVWFKQRSINPLATLEN